jgi:UPF0716 family protein affecting phage T7 exclusion
MNIRKHLRFISGIVALIIGAVSMFLPFLPLGYIMLFVGAFLLAPKIPFLRKFMKWIKKKDNSGKLEKAEDKVEDVFEKDDEKDDDGDKDKDDDEVPDKDKEKSELSGNPCK